MIRPRDPVTFADLTEPSSGEKAVSRVSGVPLKESAAPLEEWGDVGLKFPSRLCGRAIVFDIPDRIMDRRRQPEQANSVKAVR